MVRSMLNLTTLPSSFWDYALESAVRILNMVLTKKVDKTPYEIWHGKAPNLSYLKVWGCEAYVKHDSANKLHQRSVKCIFVGDPKETMGYYFYFPPENKVIVASKIPVESKSLGSPPELIPVRRPERTTRTPNHLCLNIEVKDDEVGDLREPANYKVAMLDPHKVVRSKWLYKKKTDMDAYYDYEIWQMDVKTAFLNGRLDEDIYIEQPEGYVDPKYPNRICKLQRYIYGLKQASRQWNKRFDEEIKRFRFQNRDEPCVYHKASRSDVVFLILYVDDILIMGNNIPRLKEVKDYLGKCFSMKDLGEATYILGVVDWKSKKQTTIAMHSAQAKYIVDSEAAMEAVWIRKFVGDLGVMPLINKPINMYCDNSVAIIFANEPGIMKGARHFLRRYHYVREQVETGEIKLIKVHTYDNLADPFTKSLP
nr:hypothetical protein [Tanacetum cinerariifolium]